MSIREYIQKTVNEFGTKKEKDGYKPNYSHLWSDDIVDIYNTMFSKKIVVDETCNENIKLNLNKIIQLEIDKWSVYE